VNGVCSMRRAFLNSTALTGCFVLSLGLAEAADIFSPDPIASTPALSLPAVSGPNAKISIYGGYVEQNVSDGGAFGLEGSFTAPLGYSFGFQADGSLGVLDGEFVGTVGGHIFWRDPSVGLIGGYSSYEVNEAADSNRFRVALEGQAYFDRVTLEGLIGWEQLDNDFGGDADELLALANIAFYPTDDLRLYVGYRRFAGLDLAAGGLEYQLSSGFLGNGTSIYVEGRVGDDDYASVNGGLRVFFGQGSKSLIRRHREDDPIFEYLSYYMPGMEIVRECDEGYIEFEGRCVPLDEE